MYQAILLDPIPQRGGTLKGKTMKMLKLIVAAAALVPSAAFADCYRNANGSTWCNNANSTPAFPTRAPVPQQTWNSIWGGVGNAGGAIAGGAVAINPFPATPPAIRGAGAVGSAYQTQQSFQNFNNGYNSYQNAQRNWSNPYPQRQCWNGRSYVTC